MRALRGRKGEIEEDCGWNIGRKDHLK